jgi:hypothetical protein
MVRVQGKVAENKLVWFTIRAVPLLGPAIAVQRSRFANPALFRYRGQ